MEDPVDLFPWFWLFDLWPFKYHIQFAEPFIILDLHKQSKNKLQFWFNFSPQNVLAMYERW